MNFNIIRRNYERHLWSIHNVKMAAAKGVITKEQYREITGCIYPATAKEGGNVADGN